MSTKSSDPVASMAVRARSARRSYRRPAHRRGRKRALASCTTGVVSAFPPWSTTALASAWRSCQIPRSPARGSRASSTASSPLQHAGSCAVVVETTKRHGADRKARTAGNANANIRMLPSILRGRIVRPRKDTLILGIKGKGVGLSSQRKIVRPRALDRRGDGGGNKVGDYVSGVRQLR